jgi:hypothetical protein
MLNQYFETRKYDVNLERSLKKAQAVRTEDTKKAAVVFQNRLANLAYCEKVWWYKFCMFIRVCSRKEERRQEVKYRIDGSRALV